MALVVFRATTVKELLPICDNLGSVVTVNVFSFLVWTLLGSKGDDGNQDIVWLTARKTFLWYLAQGRRRLSEGSSLQNGCDW